MLGLWKGLGFSYARTWAIAVSLSYAYDGSAIACEKQSVEGLVVFSALLYFVTAFVFLSELLIMDYRV